MRITVDSRSYEAYIGSAAWESKRKQALKTHGAFCRGCGRNQVTLHVHHRTYERLGNERPSDLVILCELCHNGVHDLVSAGMELAEATDRVVDSTPSEDKRTTVDFVPLNRRPGYTSPIVSGRQGRLGGLPIVQIQRV